MARLAATSLLSLLLVSSAIAQVQPAACLPDDPRTPLLLLGSYHMSNPGMDAFNLDADDVLVPERQRELQEVVDALAAFAPTKVAVEAPWADTATVAAYDAYVAGTRDLRRSEEEQIGFRLAHQLGHPTIYPVDVRMMLDSDPIEAVVEANPALGVHMAELQRIGQMAMDSMGTWLATGTVGAMLRKMNSPESVHLAHELYLRVFLPLVHGENYAGADLVARWYHRNLRIFANLNRIAESGDRILVVYGQGHVPTLRQFATDSPYFCLDDPLVYLDGLE